MSKKAPAHTQHLTEINPLVDQQMRLGLIYSGYRIVLAIILMFLFVATLKDPVVGGELPKFYAITLLSYFLLGLTAFVALRITKPTGDWQLFAGLIVDVLALTFMLYATGGPSIQMSMLYLVTVVAGFIVLTQKKALFITLLAAICVVYQQFFYALTQQADVRGFSGVALLSLSFMGVALLSNLVSKRLRTVEGIASTTAIEVDKLHALNQQIIERMDSGVVLMDAEQRILLCNKSAQRTLGLKYARPERFLDSIDGAFASQVGRAIATGGREVLFSPKHSRITEALSVNIHHLKDNTVLLLLENISRSRQQAQQMKLAALGRLTASIAHEIRNPIGAISQASQLLGENPNDKNQPIYHIIHKQTQRVNQIIEDVLKLSRQSSGTQEVIDLRIFVAKFLSEYFFSQKIRQQITPNLKLVFNKSQLEQVLINLVENALTHGSNDEGQGTVGIIASQEDGWVNIDVLDAGMGISPENQQQLFEPFFTTRTTGTGLGLYLSKAFCEANGATLNYLPNHAGACFRISKQI